MNLSNDTLNVLKNFATINPNLVFKPGQKLKTISESKTILASAEIVEDFPTEFGIYDLNDKGMVKRLDISFQKAKS